VNLKIWIVTYPDSKISNSKTTNQIVNENGSSSSILCIFNNFLLSGLSPTLPTNQNVWICSSQSLCNCI